MRVVKLRMTLSRKRLVEVQVYSRGRACTTQLIRRSHYVGVSHVYLSAITVHYAVDII